MTSLAAPIAIGSKLVQGLGRFREGQRRSLLLTQDAAEARRLGAIDAAAIDEQQTRAIGAALARQGASGFAVDDSALAVIGDLAARFSLEAQNARHEGQRQARRLLDQAATARREGRLSLLAGIGDAAGIAINAFGKP